MNAAGGVTRGAGAGAARGGIIEGRRGGWERDGDVRMGRYGYGDGDGGFGDGREKSRGVGESVVEKKGGWESRRGDGNV